MRLAARTKFDRSNPEPPPYLATLRAPGSRRHWLMSCSWNPRTVYSTVMNELRDERLPASRGVYVDAGCGSSADAIVVATEKRFKRAIKIDLWEPQGNMWQQRFDKKKGKRVSFIQGDICKLTDYIEPESVDCIGCNAVVDLMHKEDRHLFYEEALMALKPGGTLIVSHITLAHGHGDWCHARAEYRMVNPYGFSDVECLVATKSLLVLRKTPSAPSGEGEE